MKLRRNILLRNILPSIILTGVGIMEQQPVSHSIYSVLPVLLILSACLAALIWVLRRPVEFFDEMATANFNKAGTLSFVVSVAVIAFLVIFTQFTVRHTVSMSSSALCFVLAGMLVLNTALFMLYDIRGSRQ